MAEEEVVAKAAEGVEAGEDVSPVHSDRKRKLEDLEARENEDEANAKPQAVTSTEGSSGDLNGDSNDVGKSVPDAKRPRVDSNVPENAHQAEKLNEKPEEVLEGTIEEKLNEKPVENQKEQDEGDDQGRNAGNMLEADVGEGNAETPSVDHQENAEADEGGSPSLVARGFGTVQLSGADEQLLIQVPNEKDTLPDEKRPHLDDIPSEAFDLQLESVTQPEDTIPVETDGDKKIGISEPNDDQKEEVALEPVDWNSLSIEVQSTIPEDERPLDDISDHSKCTPTLENTAQLSEGNREEGKPEQSCAGTFQITDGDASSGGDSAQIAGDISYGDDEFSDDQSMSSELGFPRGQGKIENMRIIEGENADTANHLTEFVKTDFTHCFITDQVFDSREALIEWCQEIGRKNMFVIVIAKSGKRTGGRTARLLLGCERSGYYRDHNRKGEQLQGRKRETGTRKCGCPFTLKGIWMPGDKWKVQVHCGEHNHELPKSLAGHSHVARLNDEEKELIYSMIRSGAKAKEMLKTLKEKSKGNMSTMKTIYNAKASLKLMDMKAKSKMIKND